MSTTLNIGVIGMGWMGMAHSRGYRAIPDRFWDEIGRASCRERV